MKVQAFYTADTGSFLNCTVMRVAKALFAHIGLLFTATADEFERLRKMLPGFYWDSIPQDVDGNFRFFFESIWKVDKRTGKTGVRGPYAFAKLAEWKDGDKQKKLEIQDLPLSSKEAYNMIPFLCNAVDEIEYAPAQLFSNWKGLRLGKGISFKSRSPSKWTCIETVVRAIAYVAPEFATVVLKLGEILYEEYCPAGKRGPGFFEIIEKYNKRG